MSDTVRASRRHSFSAVDEGETRIAETLHYIFGPVMLSVSRLTSRMLIAATNDCPKPVVNQRWYYVENVGNPNTAAVAKIVHNWLENLSLEEKRALCTRSNLLTEETHLTGFKALLIDVRGHKVLHFAPAWV